MKRQKVIIKKPLSRGFTFKPTNRKIMIQITLSELFGSLILMGSIGVMAGLAIAVMQQKDELKAKKNERIR